MADCKVSTDSLAKVPDIIGVSFMPNCAKISKTTMDRGLNKFYSVFLESIKVFEPCSDSKTLQVGLSARCYRSMQKRADPHHLSVEIDAEQQKIVESHCSCNADI